MDWIILSTFVFALLEATIVAKAEINDFETSRTINDTTFKKYKATNSKFGKSFSEDFSDAENHAFESNRKTEDFGPNKLWVCRKNNLKNNFELGNEATSRETRLSSEKFGANVAKNAKISRNFSPDSLPGADLNEGTILDLLTGGESTMAAGKFAHKVKHIYLGVPMYPYLFKESRIILQKSGEASLPQTVSYRDTKNDRDKTDRVLRPTPTAPSKPAKIIMLSPGSFIPNANFEKQFIRGL